MKNCAPKRRSIESPGVLEMKAFCRRFWKETEGQDLVEYALIVAVIALGLIAAVRAVATALISLYESISAALALTT
jgi:pilus assembly protein Flp/PilA